MHFTIPAILYALLATDYVVFASPAPRPALEKLNPKEPKAKRIIQSQPNIQYFQPSGTLSDDLLLSDEEFNAFTHLGYL